LDKVVQKSGSTAFEDTVTDELSHPCEDVDPDGDVVCRRAMSRDKVVGVCGATEEDRRVKTSSDRLHQDIQSGVDGDDYGAKVRWQVRNAEPGRNWDCWCVCSLRFEVSGILHSKYPDILTNITAVNMMAGMHVM